MKVSNYWQNFHFWVNYPFNILWIEKLLVCKKQICHWISPNLFETHLSWMAWEWTNIIFLLLIMFKTNGFGLFAWDQCHFLVKNSLVGNFYLFICLFIYLLALFYSLSLCFMKENTTQVIQKIYHICGMTGICERFLWFFSDTCIVKTDILLWFGASNILDFCCFTHTPSSHLSGLIQQLQVCVCMCMSFCMCGYHSLPINPWQLTV